MKYKYKQPIDIDYLNTLSIYEQYYAKEEYKIWLKEQRIIDRKKVKSERDREYFKNNPDKYKKYSIKANKKMMGSSVYKIRLLNEKIKRRRDKISKLNDIDSESDIVNISKKHNKISLEIIELEKEIINIKSDEDKNGRNGQ